MNIFRLLARGKNNIKQDDQRIVIRVNERSKEFFLEDGFENRSVNQIKESHGFVDKNIVLQTLKNKKSLGKRVLMDYEILSFIVQQEREKGFNILLFFQDKNDKRIVSNKFRQSFAFAKQSTIVKRLLNIKKSKLIHKTTLTIKRADYELAKKMKLEVYQDQISFKDKDKERVTQIPFLIIREFKQNPTYNNTINVATEYITYYMSSENQQKIEKVLKILQNQLKTFQAYVLGHNLKKQTQKCQDSKFQIMLELINNDFQYILDYPLAKSVYFQQLKRLDNIEGEKLQAIYLCEKYLEKIDDEIYQQLLMNKNFDEATKQEQSCDNKISLFLQKILSKEQFLKSFFKQLNQVQFQNKKKVQNLKNKSLFI